MADPWFPGRWLAYDLETDSKYPTDARIVTAATVALGGGVDVVDRAWVLRPTRPIPAQAAAIHGYTTERATAEGTDPATGVELIAAELCLAMTNGVPVVGHNVVYDLTVIDCELTRHGLPGLEERLGHRRVAPVLDTLVLDKHCDPYRKGKRTLTAAATHYGVRLDQAHAASSDAMCSARIAYRIGQAATMEKVVKHLSDDQDVRERYAALAELSLRQIHDAQAGWALEQAAGLAAHFRRVGKSADAAGVEGAWPLRGGGALPHRLPGRGP